MKIVEIPKNEFVKLINELNKCREDKAKLKEANKFLNKQIKQYNEKFTKESKNG